MLLLFVLLLTHPILAKVFRDIDLHAALLNDQLMIFSPGILIPEFMHKPNRLVIHTSCVLFRTSISLPTPLVPSGLEHTLLVYLVTMISMFT